MPPYWYPIHTTIHTEPAKPTTIESISAQNSGRPRTWPISASLRPLIAEAITMVRKSPAQLKVIPKLTSPAGPIASVPTASITNGCAVICARAKPNPPSATIRVSP